MSRKKSRSAAPASTAVIPAPARALTPAAVVQPQAARTDTPAQSFRDTPLGQLLRRLFRIAASLQLAIVLLSLFTSCLILATFVESDYQAGGPIARELVYGTWWFILLLFLLATNILCAALKKYPWKKHQTGFLITHTGLLVLCFGGLLDCLRSMEGQIQAIDTQNPGIHSFFGMSDRSGTVHLANTHQLEFMRLNREDMKDEQLRDAAETLANAKYTRVELDNNLVTHLGNRYSTFQLSPGSFTWYADDHFTPRLSFRERLLKALAAPLPSFEHEVNGGATLVVKNYYAFTELWPVSKAPGEGKSKEGVVAPALRLRVRIQTPNGDAGGERWVLGFPGRERGRSPLAVELFETREPAFVGVFNKPPAPGGADFGKDGQLVVAVGPRAHPRLFRIPVDRARVGGRPTPLGDTGLSVQVKRWGHVVEFAPAKEHKKLALDPEEFPTVLVEVTGNGESATYSACARLPGHSGPVEGRPLEQFALWYHPGDFRWGQEGRMGSLQFLKGPEDKLYYRMYGKDGLRQAGVEVDPADPDTLHEVKSRMPISFRVTAYLPRAVKKESIVPVHYPLGLENPSPSVQPALRCTLTADGRSEEFWTRMGTNSPLIDFGGQAYLVRYRHATLEAPFQIQLHRAREIKDEGSNRSAAFESQITLFQDKDGKQVSSNHRVYMNNTVDVGPYRLFQANYRLLTDNDDGTVLDREHDLGSLMATGPAGRLLVKPRPVSLSGLQVKYDPGLFFPALYWMYAGSCIVVLGIATMFYMRAYFFKPRGARPTPAGDVPPALVS